MPSPPPLNCILISPIEPADPFSGDIIYTHSLLDAPPPAVTYLDYHSALQKSVLRDAHRLRRMIKVLRGRTIDSRDNLLLALTRTGLHAVREKGYLLYEDWKYLQVMDNVDLVHIYCFPTRIEPKDIPVVLSDSIGNEFYLEMGRGYSKQRIQQLYRRKRFLLDRFGIHHTTIGVDRAQKVVLFSNYGKQQYIKRGVPEHKIAVVPPGFPVRPVVDREPGDPPRFLFIANNFAIKGGYTLLKAWIQVRRACNDATLTIVGHMLPDSPDGVSCLPFQSRERIMGEIFPTHNVFVSPSRFEGFGLTPVAALSFGLACVVSNITSNPEIVPNGVAGFNVAPDDADALAEALILLAQDDRLRRAMGQAARQHFIDNFSENVARPRLRQVYDEAVA